MAWLNVEELIEDDVPQCGSMVGYNHMVIYRILCAPMEYVIYMIHVHIKLYKVTKPHL
jgi:hypothetical protein